MSDCCENEGDVKESVRSCLDAFYGFMGSFDRIHCDILFHLLLFIVWGYMEFAVYKLYMICKLFVRRLRSFLGIL